MPVHILFLIAEVWVLLPGGHVSVTLSGFQKRGRSEYTLFGALADHALSSAVPDSIMLQAKEFLSAFRQGGKPAFEISYRPSPGEVLPTARMYRSFPAKAVR
jgi:hypothetical protein